MKTQITLDSAGAKPITPGPVRSKAILKKERGVWVYQGESRNASILDLIDRERKKRVRDLRE